MAQLKREGKELPRSVDEVERMLGSWREYKTEGGGGSGWPTVPRGQLGPKGQPCALAGMEVAKNTKCPLTKKSFKACCGRALLRGG